LGCEPTFNPGRDPSRALESEVGHIERGVDGAGAPLDVRHTPIDLHGVDDIAERRTGDDDLEDQIRQRRPDVAEIAGVECVGPRPILDDLHASGSEARKQRVERGACGIEAVRGVVDHEIELRTSELVLDDSLESVAILLVDAVIGPSRAQRNVAVRRTA
jgi:hypothetical protein